MFQYFGGKGKLANYYPKPKHNIIIEPFAGSAKYSLLYYQKNIMLNDLDLNIFKAWDYLINICSIEKLEKFYQPEIGTVIEKLNEFSENEKILLRYCSGIGVSQYRLRSKVSSWSYRDNYVGSFKKLASFYCDKIKHWKITNLDYRKLENIQGTWFIDPPYMDCGNNYKHNYINYKKLSDFCLSRNGQVIICGNENDDYLPFVPLTDRRINMHNNKKIECIWTNDKEYMEMLKEKNKDLVKEINSRNYINKNGLKFRMI